MGELECHYVGRAQYELKVLPLQDVDFQKAFGRVTEYFTSWIQILSHGLGGKYVPYRGNSRSADIRDRKDNTGTEELDSDDEDSNGMMACEREYADEMNKYDCWPYKTE